MQSRSKSIDTLAKYMPDDLRPVMDPTSGDPNRFGPYKRLHRRLRGRYRLVLPITITMFLIGGAIGWRKAVPVYKAEGTLTVANSLPKVINETDQNQPLGMYEEFVQSNVLLLQSHHVVSLAVDDANFRKVLGKRVMSIEEFASELLVDHQPRTQSIDVTFTDRDPDVATEAVKATTTAFMNTYGRGDATEQAKRMQVLSERKDALAQQIADVRHQVTAVPPPTPMSIAMIDETMREMLRNESQLQTDLLEIQTHNGSSSPSVINITRRLQDLRDQIASYCVQFNAMEAATISMPPNERHIATLPEFQGLQERMDSLRSDLGETDRRIDVLSTESSLGAERFTALPTDRPSAPYSDRRLRMGAIYGFGAASVPLVLFFLIGVLDRRFRHSEDTMDVNGETPLLGVLPVLPGQQQQPEELARIAAFCVHHLRVRLQLLSDRRVKPVYMITSAAAGEGKTSLTLALGMAFATSAKRTLMIDCDPIGRGLTHRLKQQGEPGLLDSFDGAGLANVRPVVNNLDVMPAGNGDEYRQECGFNMEELEFLLEDARSQYDVILIDTGPVLSSLQAPVVAQVADHVIMTISQGLQEAMAQRSMKLLRSVGINVAGFVFNRATTHDYRQWIGGDSYYTTRSTDGNGKKNGANGHTPERTHNDAIPFGPLAASLAKIKQPDRSGHHN